MSDLAPVLRRIEADFDGSVERLCTLLRIPSISTDPAYQPEIRRAAGFLSEALSGLGFEAGLRETTGHPIVVAHHPGPGGDAPHILYYGHYDVQPPEPLDLWHSPPFEPAIVDGPRGRRVVARGAVDDKGQVMTFLEAFRAWHAVHGRFPVRMTVLLEGEEECGSPSLVPFLTANREELRADVCVVTDTNSWDIDTPAVTTRLRGMVYVEATLHGPSHDLHSGLYGGAVVNPLNELTRILGQIHDDNGRVRFDGFYEDIRPPSPAEIASWAGLGFDEAGFLAGAGLETPRGESGFSVLERIWSRPTCDINGVWGGYTGVGAKTVIPAQATVKLSCRLVPGQDPQGIRRAIKAFFEARTPPDCRWSFQYFSSAPAIEVPATSRWLSAVQAALAEIYGRAPVLVGSGGSIPVVGHIRNVLGFDSLLVGFGLDDDLIHSPNEKFELKCFRNGICAHAAMLSRFARL